jgi:DNA helicase-2/ATP-dependent DNA helicase PcrA
VRASFHYVRSGLTVSPDDLPDSDDLLALLGTTAA